MYKVDSHPILDVPERGTHTFQFNGDPVSAQSGYTIAAALHQAGYPVHSHSLSGRNRSLECGIGKCGACEMLVDGKVCRIRVSAKAIRMGLVVKPPKRNWDGSKTEAERSKTTDTPPETDA